MAICRPGRDILEGHPGARHRGEEALGPMCQNKLSQDVLVVASRGRAGSVPQTKHCPHHCSCARHSMTHRAELRQQARQSPQTHGRSNSNAFLCRRAPSTGQRGTRAQQPPGGLWGVFPKAYPVLVLDDVFPDRGQRGPLAVVGCTHSTPFVGLKFAHCGRMNT